jgi:hypothetical protein
MQQTGMPTGILAAVDAVRVMTELRRQNMAAISAETLDALVQAEAKLNRDLDLYFRLGSEQACRPSTNL